MEMITASSNLWLVLMMNRITASEPFYEWMFCYLASLLLPSIPYSLAYIFRISWRQEAQRSFINNFVAANKNNILEWGDKKIKEKKCSILTSEGTQAIYVFIDYVWDIISFSLSVTLNIIALSLVVEPLFMLSFLVSLASVSLVIKLQRPKQKRLTEKALSARVDLGQSLLSAWDNVLLGNTYSFSIWNRKFDQRVDHSLKRNVELERFDQMMAILISMMTMVPSLLVVVWFSYAHSSDSARLAAFFVTIPNLFLILTYTYQVLSQAFRYNMHKSKLSTIFKSIQPTTFSEAILSEKVKWPKIQYAKNELSNEADYKGSRPYVPPQPLTSHKDLLPFLKEPGRITLRGENGSGKSTTLMLLKQEMGNEAFLLPTVCTLSFSTKAVTGSTGENLKQMLREISEKVPASTLLLDEWDANLDSQNRESLSRLIDEIAAKKCVVEVRHR